MQSFAAEFQNDLTKLMRWRRDVRRFRSDPVDAATLTKCFDAFSLAPSVGLSEPWRIVQVETDPARAAVLDNYKTANAEALAGYSGEKAKIYSGLKLSGMQESPVQLAIFCDDGTSQGAGLGAQSMPETRRYSVVGAITLFWLTARAQGLGVGWVSILDPMRLTRDLDAPDGWSLVAYLCVGWPLETSQTPELETAGWEKRRRDLPIMTR